MSFRSMHSTFTFLACGLFISGLAMLLFIDPSSAQDASPPACDAHILTACAPILATRLGCSRPWRWS